MVVTVPAKFKVCGAMSRLELLSLSEAANRSTRQPRPCDDMTWSGVRWCLLLAAIVLTSGCIGMTDPTEIPSTTSAEEAATADARQGQVDGSKPAAMATLTIEIHASDTSVLPVDVAGVDVDGFGPAGDTVPHELVHLEPGERATVATIEAPRGTEVPAGEVTLRLDDGLGLSLLPVHVEAWPAQKDARVVLGLTVSEAGTAKVASVTGSHEAEPVHDQARPSYGYLVWPNGIKEPLPAFDRGIRVPASFPHLTQGDTVTFQAVDAASGGGIDWRLDGQPLTHGAQVTVTPEPGIHWLHVGAEGSTASASVSFDVDADLAFEGTIHAGTGPLQADAAGLNGARHEVDIEPGAGRMTVQLSPGVSDDDTVDLDLYLLDADGNTVAKSAQEGVASERLRLDTDETVPGSYTLWIHAARGAEIPYELTAHIFYG